MLSFLYQLLDNPAIFNLSQAILAPGANFLLNRHFKFIFPQSKGLILDVGCGPKLTTCRPQGKILGVDINLRYVSEYMKSHEQEGIVGSADNLPFKTSTFDEARCFGLLHHISDDVAIAMVKEMVRCTRPEGHIIILESVWPKKPFLRPLAYLNHRFDRGQWVRHEHEIIDLVHHAYPEKWQSRLFTYTFVGHEVLMLKHQKSH